MVGELALRIAFSTNDGELLVDDHFGEGRYFYIYEYVPGEGFKLVDKRINTSGEEEIHGDPIKAMKIAEILKDVDILVGYRMGPNVTRMKKRFLPIVSRTRSIRETLELLSRNIEMLGKLLERKNVIVIMEKDGSIRVVE